MADGGKVFVERLDRVGLITINRPEVRNVVDGDVAVGVESALDELDANDEIFAVVLTGAGDKAFCAGMDLRAFAKEGPRGPYFTPRGGFCGVTQRSLAKPLIIAANGTALGGGMEIALAADCVVANRTASFGLPEPKVGLMAGGGGVIRLATRVGRAIALEIIMTGDPISAQRAYEVGLVNQVAADGNCVDLAIQLANRIASASPVAVRVSRRLMIEAAETSEAEAWKLNLEAAREVLRSRDCREGQLAFSEKRPPVWTGR